jgi:tight adherence protein B
VRRRWQRGSHRPGRADSTLPLEDVAAVAERLAVLLTAGVSPAAAWAYLLPEESQSSGDGCAAAGAGAGNSEDVTTTQRMVTAAAASGRRGDSIAGGLRAEVRLVAAQGCRPVPGSRAAPGRQDSEGDQTVQAWLSLAAAWEVATESGAPLAACLRRLAEAFRDVAQLHRDLQVALAGPRATARMVLFLPVVGLLLGTVLGFNTLATLFLTVPGLLCLGGGGSLMFLAGQWNGRLVRAALARDPAPGLELELTAIAVAGGGSADHSRELVRAALADPAGAATGPPMQTRWRWRPGPATAGGHDPPDDVVDVLALSRRAGVPAAGLLRSAADQCRRTARTEGQRRAATLGVALMVPLGVCVLPAFMLVGVLPLLVSVLSATVVSSTGMTR